MKLKIHIESITYIHNTIDGIEKTKCIIRWINPITGNVQKSIGVTRKNPDDTSDLTLANRIAEGRAKIKMWRDYNIAMYNIIHSNIYRHSKFIFHERKHIRYLIKNQ